MENVLSFSKEWKIPRPRMTGRGTLSPIQERTGGHQEPVRPLRTSHAQTTSSVCMRTLGWPERTSWPRAAGREEGFDSFTLCLGGKVRRHSSVDPVKR